METRTLAKFFVGSRQAILDIAESRHGLWLGMLFVLSAGFAREYDGEDLRREPWHLLIPLGASIASSFLLYCLIAIVAACRNAQNPFWTGYRTFLTLFWMTAPLAWLYAVPVERFLTAGDSVRANLWLLALVSLWRVVLIARVISVIYRCHFVSAFCVVMLFADSIAQVVLSHAALPVISMMGGVRLTEAEELIIGTAFLLRVFGMLSLPVWLLASVVVASARWLANDWQCTPSQTAPRTVSGGLWGLAVGAIVIWAAVLPFTQSEQSNRVQVETLLRSGDLAGALRFMSDRQIGDFPPHWDPPPRIGYGEASPDIFDVAEAINRDGAADWVRSIFVQKIVLQSSASSYGVNRLLDLRDMEEVRLAAYVALLKDIDNGPEIAERHRAEIDRVIRRADDPDTGASITPSRRELILELRRLGSS